RWPGAARPVRDVARAPRAAGARLVVALSVRALAASGSALSLAAAGAASALASAHRRAARATLRVADRRRGERAGGTLRAGARFPARDRVLADGGEERNAALRQPRSRRRTGSRAGAGREPAVGRTRRRARRRPLRSGPRP